jgi:hypothetical protein
VVLQKEPRSRRVVDNNDAQILGISDELIGLQLPLDMNVAEFRPLVVLAGEAVLAAKISRLNAFVRGERHQEQQRGRAQAPRGKGRGNNRRRLRRRNVN